MNKNKVYGYLALIVYIAFMVGIGFIFNLFWKVSDANITIYWVTTAIVCLCVVFYAVLLLNGKKDKGVGAMQLFFTLLLSILPILVRAIGMIPTAGIYIALVLVFIIVIAYLFAMISMGYYANDITKNSDNRPGGTEI